MDAQNFKTKYGPWAFIAGGSVGLGGAYCDALAARGINIVTAARRLEPLQLKAKELREKYGVEVRPLQLDLGSPDLLETVARETADIEVGMLVLNAALATVNPFLDKPVEEELRKIDINCRSTVLLTHHFGKAMVARKRGGIVIMSSGAGQMGMPYVAVYSATKAFEINLAEALWFEMGRDNVDVMVCITGLTKTPEIMANTPDLKNQTMGGFMEPEDVVGEVLHKLGTGPRMTPGRRNRFTGFLLWLLPRKKMIMTAAKHHLDNFMAGK